MDSLLTKGQPINKLIEKCKSSRLTDWAYGNTYANQSPWLIHISPTNVCNNRCAICPHSKVMRKEQGFMDFNLFKYIVKQLPNETRKVYLFKQGEPFLNDKLISMVRYLRELRPDINISLHTNLTIPIRSYLPELLYLLDSLGLSISATSAETYEKVHGRDHFKQILQNLQDLDHALSGMDIKNRAHVFVDYVNQERNQEESVEKVFQFYKQQFPNIASVDFHPVFNWQGEIEEGNLSIYDSLTKEFFPRCVMPWATMAICHDGKVSYCPDDIREVFFMGDVNREDIPEIWNSEIYRNFRTEIAENKYEALYNKGFYCLKCSHLWDFHTQSPQTLTTGGVSKNSVLMGKIFLGK